MTVDSNVETVRYTYRLRPGKQAQAALEAEWHRCRFLWNEAVFQFRSGHRPTLVSLGKMLTEARANNAWLRGGSQCAQQQILRRFSQALHHSFTLAGRGRPRQKGRKRSLPSLEYTTRGFSIKDGFLTLPRGVKIPIVWSRELPSEPSSVTVYRDNLGDWYATFVVRREMEIPPAADSAIGIDWGVSATAITTDQRYNLPHSEHRKMSAPQLTKVQRKMARRRRKSGAQSNGYKRAKREAARLTKKAARRTQYESRIWAKGVVDNHGLIAVEDFSPGFLTKTPMARKAADAAIGQAKRELVERGQRAGRKVVLVQPAYTTMTCSECFARNKRLDLNVRTFLCADCGYADGRDRNAARVILAVAERGHTSVDDVRHSLSSSGALVSAV